MFYCFKEWKLDAKNHELIHDKSGTRKLREQTVRLFVYLLDKNHEVCTYDELLENLWEGKIVKKESVINEIYELRKILGADKHLVKTHRLKGFSFSAVDLEITEHQIDPPLSNFEKIKKTKVYLYAFTVLTIFVAASLLGIHDGVKPYPLDSDVVNITYHKGEELYPTTNPSEELMAYVSYIDNTFTVTIRDIKTSRSVSLPGNTSSPYWHPDKNRLFFQSFENGQCFLKYIDINQELMLSNMSEIVSCGSELSLSPIALAPEGKWLYFSFKEDKQVPYKINSVHLDTKIVKTLTTPTENTYGDYSLSLSPDGQRLAILSSDQHKKVNLRILDVQKKDYFSVQTFPFYIYNVAWHESGDKLFYIDDRRQINELDLESGQTSLVYASEEDLRTLYYKKDYGFLTSKGNYQQSDLSVLTIENKNINVLQGSDANEVQYTARQSHQDYFFVSDRTGFPQVWQQAPDSLKQVTNYGEYKDIQYLDTQISSGKLLLSIDQKASLKMGDAVTSIDWLSEKLVRNLKWSCWDQNEVFATTLSNQIWSLVKFNLKEQTETPLLGAVSSFKLDCENQQLYFTKLDEKGVFKAPLHNLALASVIAKDLYFEDNNEWLLRDNTLYFTEQGKLHAFDTSTSELNFIEIDGPVWAVYDGSDKSQLIYESRTSHGINIARIPL
ncbi:winged helix-turn-helix domain-containing protein [Pseudoalteromonas rubra]|uniref:OmpR/PhoB-type domain-containing protein n=1 Tax=Pseudoalteromonas rubra TaxID=43658 RepID=A0A0F4QQX5_9GAMM|nr:winged helix-turn-helix domain-containing protein [Pseudoalteromonas rubra]KJZ09007.1 hypothetical protein TW77_10910 [Pseudoalteromonas rubra]